MEAYCTYTRPTTHFFEFEVPPILRISEQFSDAVHAAVCIRQAQYFINEMNFEMSQWFHINQTKQCQIGATQCPNFCKSTVKLKQVVAHRPSSLSMLDIGYVLELHTTLISTKKQTNP